MPWLLSTAQDNNVSGRRCHVRISAIPQLLHMGKTANDPKVQTVSIYNGHTVI